MTSPDLEQINAALATRQRPRDPAADHRPRHGRARRRRRRRRGRRHGAADRRRLPAEGHHHPRRHRRGRPRSPASPASTSTLGVMTAEQRAGLQETLRGGQAAAGDPVRPAGLADQGLRDRLRQGRRRQVLGDRQPRRSRWPRRASRSASSTPTSTATRSRPCSASPTRGPTQVEDMIMPVPDAASGVSVISIGMLKPRRDQVVAWRGPMLDRALVQMLSRRLLGRPRRAAPRPAARAPATWRSRSASTCPTPRCVVVTTPQEAAAEVAERAGTMASMMHQRVVGVVENMSYLPCPHCGPRAPPRGVRRRRRRRVAATLSAPVRLRRPGARRDPARPDACARAATSGTPDRRQPTRLPRRPGARRRSPPRSPAAAAAWPACSSA